MIKCMQHIVEHRITPEAAQVLEIVVKKICSDLANIQPIHYASFEQYSSHYNQTTKQGLELQSDVLNAYVANYSEFFELDYELYQKAQIVASRIQSHQKIITFVDMLLMIEQRFASIEGHCHTAVHAKFQSHRAIKKILENAKCYLTTDKQSQMFALLNAKHFCVVTQPKVDHDMFDEFLPDHLQFTRMAKICCVVMMAYICLDLMNLSLKGHYVQKGIPNVCMNRLMNAILNDAEYRAYFDKVKFKVYTSEVVCNKH